MELPYTVAFNLKLGEREVSGVVCSEGRHHLPSTLQIRFIDRHQELFRDNLDGPDILVRDRSSTSTSYPPRLWILPHHNTYNEFPPFLSQPYFFHMLAKIGLRPVIHHSLAQEISSFAIRTITTMECSSFSIVADVEFFYSKIYDEKELLRTYFDRYRELESMIADDDFDDSSANDYSRRFKAFFDELRVIAQNDSAEESELIEWLCSRFLESQQQQNSRVRRVNEPYGGPEDVSCITHTIKEMEDEIEAIEGEDSDSCDDDGAPRETVAILYYSPVHECRVFHWLEMA